MGGKKSTSTSSVSIPKEVLERYNAVNQRAETAASTPYQAFGNQASDFVAQMNAQQNAGISDINATAGSYQPYMTQATAATQAGMGPAYEGINNYMSPYIKNVADTTGAYMRQQAEQAQSGALGSAISSGAFGGDRAGIAAANLQQQNQMGYGKTMADILNQGYTQALGASQADLARQLQGGAQMAGLGAQSQQLGLQGAQAKIAAGTMQQQTEQAGKDAMIEEFMRAKGYPFQTAQFLANIAMGTGAASGSTTTTQTPRNWMGFASGGGVSGYASGGVAGPRTYTKEGIGGESYVPAGDLPVGQLMVADVPEQQKGSGTEDIVKLIAMLGGGAKNGGAIDQRHGYALDGGVSYPALNTEELRRRQAGLHPDLAGAIKRIGERNEGAAMRAPLNPANMGMPGRPAPQMVAPTGVAPAETAPTTSLRPQARPEGLGAVDAMTTSLRPMPRPSGVAGADVADDAMATLGTTAKPETSVDPVSGLKTVNVGATPMDIPTGVKPIHLATAWDADRAKIIQRESGGDYDALFGFANRGDGPFADTKLTNMTVDQAINFSQPGGDYANYTKGKLGYVATPMGAFQIVGSTLNSAKAEMGLTGNEVMTPELQERIAKHLYDTYGTKPWAASEGTTGGLGGGAGLARADMTRQRDGLFANDKPYEDRNAIGKFFYDRDGSLNQNALLSVLMGIGKGAEAQTISPLGGILSGIGAGAEAYKGLQKQAADIGFTKAQTATEAVQLLKNSIYYDANLGMSVIPLAGGGQQSLADFVVNPAGPSMAGPAMDEIIRSIAGGANSRGVDLKTAKPEEIFSGAPLPTGQGAEAQPPAAGMPVPPVVTPYESFGTFPLGDLEQAYIAQAETRARSPMTAPEREASIARSEASRAAADAGTASASLAFRNTNELAATVAKAAAGNDLGPLGGVIATYENLAAQAAGMFGIEYDGTAASSQALLNKLSTLSADQMTADTAAAALYLQNKNIFPDIKTNPTAAAEITAEMLTKNMFSYEKGQYINDLYRAQKGVVKDLTGADALFNKQAGSIYQGEKTNIADLLKYAGNAEADPEVKQLVVEFFDSANRGAFKDQADAQAAIEAIFTVLPGQHNVSSGLGRYFVQ
jgi:hypothetical protein